jgi:hypothetical protein
MELKKIDPGQTVYNLCKENPGIENALKAAGFTDIVNPIMRNTAGRVMTLEKGMKFKKIDAGHLKKVLNEHGYTF